MSDDSYTPDRSRSATVPGGPRVRAGAVVAIALLAAFGIWLLFVRGGDEPAVSPAPPAPEGTAAVTEEGLRTLAAATSTPIYWVGPRSGHRYELTTTNDGEIYVRYLPRGAKAGSSRAYLTIGTYALDDAFAATGRAAGQSGSVRVPVPGGVAFYNEKAPANVYLAERGSLHQIEVYDPSGAARRLVTSGAVVEVAKRDGTASRAGGTPTVTPLAVLREVAGSRAHPVYWLGPQGAATYELTETAAGVYIRYLRRGDRAGTAAPRLTIGTYPMADAFGKTRTQASRPDAVRIPVGADAVAFYDRRRPTNVYVAYAGSDAQVEVYDADARRAHELVRSRSILALD